MTKSIITDERPLDNCERIAIWRDRVTERNEAMLGRTAPMATPRCRGVLLLIQAIRKRITGMRPRITRDEALNRATDELRVEVVNDVGSMFLADAVYPDDSNAALLDAAIKTYQRGGDEAELGRCMRMILDKYRDRLVGHVVSERADSIMFDDRHSIRTRTA